MVEVNKIIQGDSLEVMQGLPDNSIDTIITDPPYGLSFMGKKWDYDVPSIKVWKDELNSQFIGTIEFGSNRNEKYLIG